MSGDPPAAGPYPDTTAVFDIDSIGLTNVVHGLNRGVDPGGGSIGPPTEFHSAYLSLLQTNRALFGATKLVLFMNLFFGGATGWVELAIKTWAIYMVAIAVGVAFPRFRIDQSIRFFFKIPTLIGIASIVYVQMALAHRKDRWRRCGLYMSSQIHR